MGLFDFLKKQSSDDTLQGTQYAMNEFSPDARRRSELFLSLVGRQNIDLEVIPGRYGGEYNNDMLAIGNKEGTTLLFLGIKVTDDAGNLQLDANSLGPYVQFSDNWMDALTAVLSISDQCQRFGEQIEAARKQGTLRTIVLLVNKLTQDVQVLPVAVPS